jgi:hypothetical protein
MCKPKSYKKTLLITENAQKKNHTHTLSLSLIQEEEQQEQDE